MDRQGGSALVVAAAAKEDLLGAVTSTIATFMSSDFLVVADQSRRLHNRRRSVVQSL